MSTEGQEGAVFLRKASGVVRAMSVRDGAYYGYLSSAGLYGIMLFLFIGAGVFPHANFFLANLISLVFFLAIYVVYANLASAMPRSGGDYVFTSRLLSPRTGFTIAWAAWVFWGFFFVFLAASTIVTGVIAPMFSAIGVANDSQGWINAADTVTEWYVRIPIMIVLMLIAGWILVSGMKHYVRIQKYYMMPASIIGLAILVLTFLLVDKSTFFSNLDTFQGKVGGLESGDVVSTAARLGFVADHSSLFDTLAFSVNLTFLYVWTIWSSELLGEIKSASKLTSSFKMYAGAGLLTFITFTIGIWGTYQFIGLEWMRSFSWLVVNDPASLGGAWDFRGVATLFYVPSLNIGLGIIIFLCFLGPVSMSLFNPQLSSSRLLLAMSFDRLLPSWFGRVNSKGVPHVAIWFGVALSIALAIAVEIVPDLTKLLFWSSFATLLGILASLLGGLVFPWRRKAIFEASPGAKYRVFGLPAISVAAIVGSVFILGSMVISLAHPGFGLLDAGPARVGLVTLVVVTVIPAIGYTLIKRAQSRKGIEVEHAFTVIPPE